MAFVLSVIPSLSCNKNSLKNNWLVIVDMSLNVSPCLVLDWIIYVCVKWSVKLLESSAISISATTSCRGRDLCILVLELQSLNCGWGRRRRETWTQRDKWQGGERQGETDSGRKEGARNKRESDRAVGGVCCLSAQREQNVSFCAASVSDGCHYPTQWV